MRQSIVSVLTLSRAAIAGLLMGAVAPQIAPAETAAGAYLAGRVALFNSDFDEAAAYYTRALTRDAANPGLMEHVVTAQLALGRIDAALPVASRMQELGLESQMANMVIIADLIDQGKFEALLDRATPEQGVSPLVDGLMLGWAHMGAGSVSQALEQFDAVADDNGLRGFAMYHKALALASVGDFEGAEAIFADTSDGTAVLSRRGALAYAEVLSQLERDGDAADMLRDAFGPGADPAVSDLIMRLDAGETLPFTHVRSARDGMAEIFFSIAVLLSGENASDYGLIYARMAHHLRPDHIDALLLCAELLDDAGQYDLSVEIYKQVPKDSPDFHAAELGRAEALRRAGKPDTAIEVLERLAVDYPGQASVQSALGGLFREQEDYASAAGAYDRALELTPENGRNRWFLLYARGIAHERLDHWDQAEADFRAALELNPDQPQVLNYLGYSLVEKQEKLDEALDMIKRAVASRPDSGYIVDSLGWVLYRLGRYEEAVGHMEDAVSLMPVDAVVNDHLGDVYWAVGRRMEAEFQWRRALSFVDPTDADSEADPERIRRKLEVGLDRVLEEEGAPPISVANDGG
ncbi:tetratricopeptide repeat protein [Marinibacterium profundimaris]|uniref:tetratricopeptide repeat protein n=1 Tax=Marinibacterium profundimaris TaxID=1679460 RepID=UPI000B52710F